MLTRTWWARVRTSCTILAWSRSRMTSSRLVAADLNLVRSPSLTGPDAHAVTPRYYSGTRTR